VNPRRIPRELDPLCLILAAAMLALALAGGGYSGVALGSATAVVWVIVLFLLLIGRLDPPTRLGRPFLIAIASLFALGALMALSLGWTSDAAEGFTEVVRVAGYLGVFVLVGACAGPGSGRRILKAVVLAVVGVALVALGARLLGLGGGDSDLTGFLPTASGRLSYPIGYWNGLGALMALGMPVLIHLASGAGRRLVAGGWLAAAVPILLALYMTSSRGALLAGLLGSGVVIACSQRRGRALAAAVLAAAASAPAILAASFAAGILDSTGGGRVGGSELLVLATAAAGIVAAVCFGRAALERLDAAFARVSRPPRIAAGIAAIALVIVTIGLAGPSRLIDDFRAVPGGPRASQGLLLSSGSGRAQFWGVALSAFADEPLRGIGAGGYPTYWNQEGSLGTPARNAHSEPLEVLAELGIFGFAAFILFAGTVGMAAFRRARSSATGGAAACGLLVAGSIGWLIDWTWQVPAVTVPILVVAAGVTGRAFAPAGAPSPVRAETARSGLGALGPALAATGIVALAVASIWAGGVQAVYTSELDDSHAALTRGDVNDAAAAARMAAQVQPWAADPYLQLAEAERSVGNIAAARLDVTAAIERRPDDFRAWYLASTLPGDPKARAPFSYGLRSVMLAPSLWARISEFAVDASPSGG
jgi:hypothetical protein